MSIRKQCWATGVECAEVRPGPEFVPLETWFCVYQVQQRFYNGEPDYKYLVFEVKESVLCKYTSGFFFDNP